ncbi:MAG: hypothetical protein QOF11_680 [Chloroflexota bacterium]|nr:hypothetical protein [Chloroflexota bacterium]
MRGFRLALTVLSVLVTLVAASVTFADNGRIKLALRAVDQPGSYFDLTMRPGETRSLEVEIANAGDATVAVRTYAADVYTIINGGFGARLRDEPRTGTTTWLSYPTGVTRLDVGKGTRRSFAVAVPATTGPGEYITSLVLENDQPITDRGAVALSRIVRQAVAVVVTVPGRRSPGLLIGEATHTVVAGNSIVAIAVENTGNVRLKPIITFTLRDAVGAQVSHTRVPMDTFYARTNTFVEIPLAGLLLPGTYTVHLTLNDAAQGARADATATLLVTETPAPTAEGMGATADLTGIDQTPGEGGISLPLWSVALLTGSVLGAIGIVFLDRRRRHRRATRTTASR